MKVFLSFKESSNEEKSLNHTPDIQIPGFQDKDTASYPV
jgi:hypothetical protein